MSWQVGSEKLKTQPSQQPGPSLSHNERLKGVERSAHSNLDWWEDPSENCILIPSSKRKKTKQISSQIKVLLRLKCQPFALPVLPLEFFYTHIFQFYTFLSGEDIIKRFEACLHSNTFSWNAWNVILQSLCDFKKKSRVWAILSEDEYVGRWLLELETVLRDDKEKCPGKCIPAYHIFSSKD